MFGKLPELFERNFAMGYFLPVAAFVVATLLLFDTAGIPVAGIAVDVTSQIDALVGGVMIGLVSWFVSVFLLVVNRDLLRFMEGYGRYNPARLLAFLERRRYQRLQRDIKTLEQEYRDSLKDERKIFSSKKGQKLDEILRQKVETFPDEQFMLPTRIGNTIRAFEVYPTNMYGIDAIYGWNRLQAVMPDEYRNLVNDAKAQVDFWMNLWFLSLIFLLEYTALIIYTRQFFVFWLPLFALIVIPVSYTGVQRSAVEWGDLIKAAFDIFLPDLRRKLNFKEIADKTEERKSWTNFSRAIIYVVPDDMPERVFSKESINQEYNAQPYRISDDGERGR